MEWNEICKWDYILEILKRYKGLIEENKEIKKLGRQNERRRKKKLKASKILIVLSTENQISVENSVILWDMEFRSRVPCDSTNDSLQL